MSSTTWPVADLLAAGSAQPQQGRGDAVADVEVAAQSRLSSTVRCSNSSMFWKVRATPARAMRSGLSPTRSRPAKRMAPSWGRYRPDR